MVTQKLTAIWRIITTKNFSLLSSHKDKVKYLNHIGAELSVVMTLAVAMDRNYRIMMANIKEQAVEEGELHTLEALKKAIEDIN